MTLSLSKYKKEKKMDNLANLFSSIQNGQQRHKRFIQVPFSKKSWHICNILFLEGFLQGFFAEGDSLFIFLKYSQNKPVIRKIHKISLQGRKIYRKTDTKSSKNQTQKSKAKTTAQSSFSVTILSTSKGILSDRDARFFGIGGEVLCTVVV